ncbi:MAG: MFS transporter [Deinococcota bacterium]
MTYNQQQQVVLLCVIVFLTTLAGLLITPLVPVYATGLGASLAVVGLLDAAAFGLSFFLAIPFGSLVDRFGPRTLIGVGVAGFALSPLAVLLTETLPGLAVTQMLLGVSHLSLIVASQTLITGFATGKQQERYMGWYAMMISSAQMLGPLIGGSLADAFSFRVVFAVACVVPVIPWVLSRQLDGMPKITSNEASSKKRMTPNLTNVRSILTLRGAQLAILSSVGILLTQRAYSTFFPVLLDRLGYSVSAIGLLLSLRALSSTLIRPFIPNVVAVFKTRPHTLFVVMASIGMAVVGAGFSQLTGLFVLFTALMGVCGGISQPVSVLMMANAVSVSERGFALGLRLMGNRLAQVTSPLVFGLVADLWRLEGAFLGAGLAAAGLAAWFWTLIPAQPSPNSAEQAADD